MTGFLTSNSVSLANGSDVVYITGSVDCSNVYSGTAVFIDGELLEGIEGTEPDGSGNSTITLRYTYLGTSISGASMVVFNTIEGLRDAIDKAGEIIEQYETHLLTVVDIVRGGTGATTVEGMRSAFSLYSKAEVDNAIAAMEPDSILPLVKGGTGATTAAGVRYNLGLGTSSLLAAGAANGTATLDVNGKVPLTQINDSLLGQVEYKGLWNPSNNTPTLPTTPTEKGHYYICSSTGTQFGITFATGDWIISSGTQWGKVDNTDAVSSVQGRTGNVVLTAVDVDAYTKEESDSRYLTSDGGLLSPFGLIPLNGGVWSSGQTFSSYSHYMIYNGEYYKPLPLTTLPYTVGASPDLDSVYKIQLDDHSKLFNLNAAVGHDAIYARGFDDIDSLVNYEGLSVGNSYSSGGTTWLAVSDSNGMPTSNPSLFLQPITTVYLSDCGKNDGVENALDVLVELFRCANFYDSGVDSNKATFTLIGSEVITVQTGASLYSCNFLVGGWTGYFHIKRKQERIIYGTSSQVTQSLINGGGLGYTSSNYSGWNGVQEISDSFIKIEHNQDFYRYRGNIQKRVDLNVSYSNGSVSTPNKYPITDVNFVEVYPMEKRYSKVCGLNLDISDADVTENYIRVETSRFTLEDTCFKSKGSTKININPLWVNVVNSANIIIRNLKADAIFTTATTGYAYGLGINESYDVQIIGMKGEGDGWGVVGSTFFSRVHFLDCDINRVDCHQPFQDSLKITRCNIGTQGVAVTAIGDLTIESCDFIMRNNPLNTTRALIRTRNDCSGFCDGNLTVKDCTIKSSNQGSYRLMQHELQLGNSLPVGSPIRSRVWDSIVYDNISTDYQGDYNLAPYVYRQDTVLTYPSEIRISNCTGKLTFEAVLNNQLPNADLTTSSGLSGYQHNLYIHIDNTKLTSFAIREETTSLFRVLATLKSVTPRISSTGALTIRPLAAGDYSITDSKFSTIVAYTDGIKQKANIKVSGSVMCLDNPLYPDYLLNYSKGVKGIWSFTNCDFHGADVTKLLDVFKGRVDGCSFFQGETVQEEIPIAPSLDSPSGTMSLAVEPIVGQRLDIIVQSSDGDYVNSVLHMPKLLQYSIVPIPTTSGWVKFYRATSNTLIVTSSGVSKVFGLNYKSIPYYT